MTNLSAQTTSNIVSQIQLKLDLEMVPFDLWASSAHVLMLYQQKIISLTQAKSILSALQKIKNKFNLMEYEIDPQKGAHLSLEAEVIKLAGSDGQAMHTARSRNDQVMVTELLFLKEKTLEQLELVQQVVLTLHKLANKHLDTVIPGYTHMQPAKVTSFGEWCLAYAQSLLEAAQTFQHYYQLYNQNPLGSCEGYGTSWPIDKKYTTKLLGFDKTWQSPQAAISSRGMLQLGLLTSQQQLSITMSKLSQDLLLFNTFEYGYLSLGENIAQQLHPITGSSIMAQKKNPDILELIRSTAGFISGLQTGLAQILSSLPMGYNRDSREAKELIALGIGKTNTAMMSLQEVLSSLEINKVKMLKAVENNYSLTTELADSISQKFGVPYRQVYKVVGCVVAKLIKKSQQLSKISDIDLNYEAKQQGIKFQISKHEIKQIIIPAVALKKKSHSVKIIYQEINHQLFELNNWVENQKQVIKKAKNLTQNKVASILNL